ncbi:ROK family protein [uncultured Olegusella sp.]|uniref:ROK family protein n=1 Tax=uncultured Olegusella sp. TaxID=1979846 RepID=UPI0026142B08|nr:ROK family protein [uncultured Olegusella sp.]
MAKETAVIGVDIGGTKIACGIVLLSEDSVCVEAVEKVPTEAKRGGKHVLATVIEQVKAAQTRARELGVTSVGVGISSAGVVNPRNGDITFANDLMPGWGGTHLGAEVSARSGLPCRVLNDVHAHALGEARRGSGRGMSSCLVVAVGTGIGGAYIERGTIMLGAHDEAGHIGHVACIAAAGVPCSCGATGHLEPIAAGPGIIEEFLRLGGSDTQADGSPMDGAEIDRLAAAGDSAAKGAEERAGRALGEVLGSMCNMLDPACVILSGSVAQCGPDWSDAMHQAFMGQAMPPVQKTAIVSGELGGEAPIIGAAENFLHSGYAEISE